MPSVSNVQFPPPHTFDILPPIHDLISRLPLALPQPPNSNNTLPQTSTSEPLDPKDLPQAAVPIKLKIQKAKAAVSSLPDVDRTIEDQEDEIRELKRKIAGLRGLMRELGRRAGERIEEADGEEGAGGNGNGRGSQAMEGMEQA